MDLGGCIASSIYIIIINKHQTANEDQDFDAEEGCVSGGDEYLSAIMRRLQTVPNPDLGNSTVSVSF